MNDQGTKRREWVKNAVIIFLTVMLLLTFFSNTIMNYSLPEVAAQYIQSGTITAKIRGTGMVESGDPYEVIISDTRIVESVSVKTGDTVVKGDALFILEDQEDETITLKEEELKKAVLAFETAILTGDISSSVWNNVQSGGSTSITTYQNKILAAEAVIEARQQKVDEIQTKINEITTSITTLKYGSADTSAEARALYNAQNAYEKKNDELTYAKNTYNALLTEYREAETYIKSYEAGSVSGNDLDSLKAQYDLAKQKLNTLPALIRDAENQVTSLQSEVYNLNIQVNNAQSALDSKTDNSGSIKNLEKEQAKWELELEEKKSLLSEAEEERTQLIKDIAAELSLNSEKDNISKLQEELAELRAKAIGAVVEAPVSGTVTSISITAGEKTGAEKTLATMQPEGKGFTLSFSVTNDQAKRLSVGTAADLVNAWRYDDIQVTLASIKPDTTDPASKKLLTFNITGSVVAGQSLSLSVGDKSSSYDMIVPNSAIREDNNGKFILVVESKSSPLGNRYVATRYDVDVVASDDTQSAITGGLYGYEFVITTSTKPVEAGQLVRLSNQ